MLTAGSYSTSRIESYEASVIHGYVQQLYLPVCLLVRVLCLSSRGVLLSTWHSQVLLPQGIVFQERGPNSTFRCGSYFPHDLIGSFTLFHDSITVLEIFVYISVPFLVTVCFWPSPLSYFCSFSAWTPTWHIVCLSEYWFCEVSEWIENWKVKQIKYSTCYWELLTILKRNAYR